MWRRLWYLVRHRQLDAELAEEIETHRAMAQAAREAEGLPPDAAAHAARRALGNDLAARAWAKDAWMAPWLQDLGQDVRLALRRLVQAPAFAAIVIGVLGLGIGVNHLFLTLVYAHVLRGFAIERPDRVLYVSAFDNQRTDQPLSYAELDYLRHAATGFHGIAAYAPAPLVVSDDELAPDRLDGVYVSGNALAVIGVQPLLGRTFSADDDRPGAPRVVVLGEATWRGRYAGDPAVLGRMIRVNGDPAAVIGVVPARSGFPSTAEVWLPLAARPDVAQASRAALPLRVFGRLRDETPVEDGRAELERLVAQRPLAPDGSEPPVRAHVVSINERFFGHVEGPWLAFLMAGLIVVAVAATNVANLMLARATEQAREIAVRTALGASRLRVVRQLLVEGLVLAVAGAAAGLGLSRAATRLFTAAIPANTLPYWVDYSPDARILLMLVLVSSAALLVFGVLPALQGSRVDVAGTLAGAGRTVAEGSVGRWRAAFLVGQLALGVILLALLVLGFRSGASELPAERGLATDRILTAAITLPPAPYATTEHRRRFYRQLLERVRALPGVVDASMASALPRRGAVEQRVWVNGDEQSAARVSAVAVGSRYLESLGLTTIRGTQFTDTDTDADADAGAAAQVLVNQRFAESVFPGQDAVGRDIAVAPVQGGEAARRRVIGVVPDLRQRPTPRSSCAWPEPAG